MIEAPQGKRFTPVTSSLRWQSLMRGCKCKEKLRRIARENEKRRLASLWPTEEKACLWMPGRLHICCQRLLLFASSAG